MDELPGDLIDLDASGHIWAAGEEGESIYLWGGEQWSSFDQSQGWLPVMARPVSRKVLIDGGGQTWLATQGDVRAFEGQGWLVYTPAEMGMGPPEYEDGISSFGIAYLERVGQIWVYQCDWMGPGPSGGRGVRWFDGVAWHGADSPVARGCATAVEEDAQGHIWMSLEDNLWRYTPATDGWQQFPPPETPEGWNRFGFVDSLSLAPDGDPWVAMVLCGGASCYGGVARYHIHDGVWTQIGEDEHDSFINRFVFDGNGTTWLFNEKGLFKINQNIPKFVAPLFAWNFTTDLDGNLWVAADYAGQSYLWKQENSP
jgi:hypothetical protein